MKKQIVVFSSLMMAIALIIGVVSCNKDDDKTDNVGVVVFIQGGINVPVDIGVRVTIISRIAAVSNHENPATALKIQ